MIVADERRGMLAATAAYVIFGFSFLFSKMALGVAEPAILLFARFAVTFLTLNLLVLFRAARLNLRGKNVLPALLLGVIQPVLYFTLENYGIKYTTASFSGMFAASIPIFSAVLGAIVLRERPNWKQWVFIAVSIAGVVLVSVGGAGGENSAFGAMCLLGAYVAAAVYTLLVRRMSLRFSAFEMTYLMFAVGFAFFTALAAVQYRGEAIPMLRAALSEGNFAVSAVYLGVLSSVGAFFLINYSIARLPVARAVIFGNLSAIVSVAAGVLILGDAFTVKHALAFVMILAGVWGVNRLRDNGV